MIPLTKLQNELMEEFYSIQPTKVIYRKSQRKILWQQACARRITDLNEMELNCPALAHQIKKSLETGKNIQSAVFSECVYAQTFANMLGLDKFVNCLENHNFLPEKIIKLIKSYSLYPRYAYSNNDSSRILIQAGGCNGIDSALITVLDLNIYTIEFKEPGAKTSEPDLPKYDESGNLKITDDFIRIYPQFEAMLNEQKNLNFFELMGNNEHKFSPESVNIAITNNYAKKYADVVCTEDSQGYLVMMPVNQISLWADVGGEIRPAGRNHYKVWTPNALNRFLFEKGAEIINGKVRIETDKLKIRTARGGNRKISGYKINSIFFVYFEKCIKTGNFVEFNYSDIQQLNPTIAGKISFKGLKYANVKDHYFN